MYNLKTYVQLRVLYYTYLLVFMLQLYGCALNLRTALFLECLLVVALAPLTLERGTKKETSCAVRVQSIGLSRLNEPGLVGGVGADNALNGKVPGSPSPPAEFEFGKGNGVETGAEDALVMRSDRQSIAIEPRIVLC